MRILLLTASLPYPPASGGALRTYGLISGLHAAGHHITLLSFHDNSIAPESTPLAQWCQHIETLPPPHRAKTQRLRDLLLTHQPDIARRMYSPAFETRLRTLLTHTQYDLIQCEGIEMACYLPAARQTQPTAKLCFDTFNAEYALQRAIFDTDRRNLKHLPAALYSLIQSRRIYHFERAMCQMADCVLAVSPEDAVALCDFRADKRIAVVPNGIFTAHYDQPTEAVDLGSQALVFTGKMDYRPNVDAALWFAHDILPLVQQRVPEIHFYVIGQQPHKRLQPLRQNPNITLTGWVDSVQPYLHAAAVYVAPLRMGSGTRLKLLEAMSAGCAIIATPAAAAGLLSETKDAMLICETASDIAQNIIRLLQDPDQRRALGQKARAAVKDSYDWRVLIPRLLAAYKEIGLG